MDNKYAIPEKLTKEDIKELRMRLKMSQRECAEFLGVSTSTIERWESGKDEVKGPVAVVCSMIKSSPEYLDRIRIPEKKFRLRVWYMHNSLPCTLIDVDEENRRIAVKNYVDARMFKAFGEKQDPSYEDYEEFLKSRCFPETRDKIKIQLELLGLPYYDPMLIIEKTEGRMAEDHFWLRIER